MAPILEQPNAMAASQGFDTNNSQIDDLNTSLNKTGIAQQN